MEGLSDSRKAEKSLNVSTLFFSVSLLMVERFWKLLLVVVEVFVAGDVDLVVAYVVNPGCHLVPNKYEPI